MQRSTFLATAAMCAALALFAAPARAAIFCVHDAAELETALDTASGNGTNDEIRLFVGHYLLTSTLSYYADPNDGDSLILSGGWISFFSSCDTQFPDASLTEIDGDGSASLKLLAQGSYPASLQAFNFSLVNPGTAIAGTNAGLLLGAPTSPNLVPDVYVGNVIVRGCSNAPLDCGLQLYGSMNALVRNVLIVDNVGYRVIGVTVNANSSGSVVLNHVTAAHNQSYNSYPGIYLDVPVPVTIANSVLWGNIGQSQNFTCDLISEGSDPKLVSTTIGNACSTLDGASSGVSDADPLFAGPGNYRLKAGSPAVDGGVGNPPGGLIIYDLDGHARSAGGAPDRGAYELKDGIFGDGFE